MAEEADTARLKEGPPGDTPGDPTRRRGLHPWLTPLSFVLLTAGAGGLAVGLYGQLQPCKGSCAETTDPVTASDYFFPALVAGGIGLLLGLALMAWLVARARKVVPADEDASIGDERVRVCPKCSTQSRTTGDYCPHCGASFLRRRGMSRTAKAATLTAVAAVCLAAAGLGTFLYIESVKDQKDRRIRLARAYEQKQREAEEAQAEAEAEAAIEESEVASRQSLLTEVEKAITKDMQKRSQEEFAIVEGPILGTQCDPEPGGDIEDLSTTSLSLDCLAYNKESGGKLSGSSVSSTVNFDTGEFTWKLGG